MYFSNFPRIYYTLPDKDKELFLILTDITTNIRIKKEVLENITLYDEYDIKDGETPEIIAERIYGNPNYHWIIMLVNQRYNYLNDFPLTYDVLEEYTTKKYGAENIYNIHHYERDGLVVDNFTVGATPVTNYDFETSENEKKRRIKLISPSLIQQILTEFERLV
jgi:hypothetical protein